MLLAKNVVEQPPEAQYPRAIHAETCARNACSEKSIITNRLLRIVSIVRGRMKSRAKKRYGNRSRTIWETKFQLPNRITDFEIRRHCLQEILLSGYFLNLLPENGGEKEKFGGQFHRGNLAVGRFPLRK